MRNFSEAPPNKARRLTADDSVGRNGSLSHNSPASPSGNPLTMAISCRVPLEGSAAASGASSHHPSQYPHQYHCAGDAAVMALEGAPGSQRVEVALDDGGGDEHQHLHGDGRQGADGSGVDGGGDAAENGGGGGGDPEHEAAASEGPVTDTITVGLIGMRQRRAVIEQQIDELTNVAVDYLEAMKKDFIDRMARLKGNVAMYCNVQEAEWRETNAMTQEALRRLDAARSLVRSLGLSANPGGQELSSDAVMCGAGHGDIACIGINGLGAGEGGDLDGVGAQEGDIGSGL